MYLPPGPQTRCATKTPSGPMGHNFAKTKTTWTMYQSLRPCICRRLPIRKYAKSAHGAQFRKNKNNIDHVFAVWTANTLRHKNAKWTHGAQFRKNKNNIDHVFAVWTANTLRHKSAKWTHGAQFRKNKNNIDHRFAVELRATKIRQVDPWGTISQKQKQHRPCICRLDRKHAAPQKR